jgi:hypothetical protein
MMLLVGAFALVALVGCDQERGGPRVVGEDGTEIEITATPAETGTATIVATAEQTGTPAAAPPEATQTPATTPTGTPTSTATSTSTPSGGSSGEGGAGGSAGVPYGTGDVRAALAASGDSVEVDDEREPLCPDSSVPETALQVGDSSWALWVYEDTSAREAEWQLDDGQLEPQIDGCEPPSGFNYFNANTVLVLLEGVDSVEAVRDAFLEMGATAPEED